MTIKDLSDEAVKSLDEFVVKENWKVDDYERMQAFLAQQVTMACEKVLEEVKEVDLAEIERCARVLQKSLCGYSTTDGDKRTCDCKFAWDREKQEYKTEFPRSGFSEECGCAEARRIIREICNLEAKISELLRKDV